MPTPDLVAEICVGNIRFTYENNNIIDKVHFYYEGGIIYNAYYIHDNFSLMSAKVQTFWR